MNMNSPPISDYSVELDFDHANSDATLYSMALENYEALLELASALATSDKKPRGLSSTEINQISSCRYHHEDVHLSDQTSCVVCMCDFKDSQVLRVLPCSHEFHVRCLDKWLKHSKKCPICRGEAVLNCVDEENDFYGTKCRI